MGRHRAPALSSLEDEYVAQLKSEGKTAMTIKGYRCHARRFIRYVGDVPLNRVTEEQTREFFKRNFAGKKALQKQAAMAIGQLLKLAAARLPVVVKGQGFAAPVPAVQSEKGTALRRQWAADKLQEKREVGEDLTVKLARSVIDSFLYFQSRLNEQGSAESVDELSRLRDNAQELIQNNLALFMSLSAKGKNLHPIIDERITKS